MGNSVLVLFICPFRSENILFSIVLLVTVLLLGGMLNSMHPTASFSHSDATLSLIGAVIVATGGGRSNRRMHITTKQDATDVAGGSNMNM